MIKYRSLKITTDKDDDTVHIRWFINSEGYYINCPFQSNYSCTPDCAALIKDESEGMPDLDDCTPIYRCLYRSTLDIMFIGLA